MARKRKGGNPNPAPAHRFKKGNSGNPNGRAVGTQNVVTKDFRNAVSQLLNDCGPELLGWIERIAVKKPDRAIECLTKLAEFATPKLNRTELAGDINGNPILVKQIVDDIRAGVAEQLDSPALPPGSPSGNE